MTNFYVTIINRDNVRIAQNVFLSDTEFFYGRLKYYFSLQPVEFFCEYKRNFTTVAGEDR